MQIYAYVIEVLFYVDLLQAKEMFLFMAISYGALSATECISSLKEAVTGNIK